MLASRLHSPAESGLERSRGPEAYRDDNQPTTPQAAMIVTLVAGVREFAILTLDCTATAENVRDDSTHQGIDFYCLSETDRCHHHRKAILEGRELIRDT